MYDEITYPFPNFNSETVEVWEWIRNFIIHFIGDVITYPCWDLSQSMLVKGAPDLKFLITYLVVSHDFDPAAAQMAGYIIVHAGQYAFLLYQTITVELFKLI